MQLKLVKMWTCIIMYYDGDAAFQADLRVWVIYPDDSHITFNLIADMGAGWWREGEEGMETQRERERERESLHHKMYALEKQEEVKLMQARVLTQHSC